jgi:hypothetical protein
MKKSRNAPQHTPDNAQFEFPMEWEEVEDRWFETDFDDIDDDTRFAFWQAAGHISETEMTCVHKKQPSSTEAP